MENKMENYEKKYKQALEKCRIEFNLNNLEYSNLTYSHEQIKQILEHIFPELKESEESKIIDALKIAVCSYCSPNHNYVNTIPKGRLITWLEKQGEQKPTDKVEPKFKVGDWCIDNENNTIFQITKVLSNLYYYRTNEGKEYSCTRDSIERDAHLWTIDDAKDGDVLATKDAVFIFKHMDKAGLSLCRSYCEVIGNSKLGLGFDFSINGIHPANNEQRNFLFQKMKEVGYKWNFFE